MEVVVEVVVERGNPARGPAHAAFRGLDLLERRAGNGYERDVAMGQVLQRAFDVIHLERAADAAVESRVPVIAVLMTVTIEGAVFLQPRNRPYGAGRDADGLESSALEHALQNATQAMHGLPGLAPADKVPPAAQRSSAR